MKTQIITLIRETLPAWPRDALDEVEAIWPVPFDRTVLRNVSLSPAGDTATVLTADLADRSGLVVVFTKL